jgi:cell wall-associated NlpC family hydrolase
VGDLVTSVNLLASLQQVQSMLASMYPAGTTSTGTTGASGAAGISGAGDDSTISSFEQILAALSSQGTPASGIMGTGLTTADATSSTAVSSGPTGADVVADAKKYLGVPYVLDGESTKGMDCSGLVQKTYKDLGITLGRGVHEQMTEGTAVPSLAQAQPGDLIVFKGGGHVAIYEGNDTVIHAPYPGRVVCNEKLWVGDSGIQTIRRIVPSAGTTSTDSTGTSTASTTATTGSSAATTSAASTSSVGTTSAAVQAAALAAVQAIIQADFGLLSSSQSSSSSSSLDSSANSPSAQIAAALSSFESASGIGTSTTAATTSTTSATSAQQALAMEQSILAQEQI